MTFQHKVGYAIGFLLVLGMILYQPLGAQVDNSREVQFGPSFRIYPSEMIQTEVFIVKDPNDDQALFSSCNTINFIPFFASEGVYVSADGGMNWRGSDTCTGEPITFHGGDPGITIDKNGTFIMTRLGRPPFSGLFAHYSNDRGQTWSAQVAISTDDLERASLTTDPVATSPFYGRSYAVWIKFAQPFPLMFSSTDDGGQSWSVPVAVNTPEIRSAGGDITIGPEGEVYACWAGVTETSPFKEILVGFARSLDGGASWQVNENAFPVNGITGVLETKENIRVNGLPGISVDTTDGPRRGWIYMVTGQRDLAPAGSDPDIILYRSTDGGDTWSDGIRVNQDEPDNGKIQYFPSIHIDRFGAINIIFYDDRNTTADSAGVFLARSEDGGDTWKEWEIGGHAFRPEPIGGLVQGYQGDNIDLTSTQTHIWPVWMDNSTGHYQVWTTPIDFSGINYLAGPAAGRSNLTGLKMVPNPVSDQVILNFNVVQAGEVSVKILDQYGREVAVLADSRMTIGPVRLSWNRPAELPAGFYLVTIGSLGSRVTGKMIIID